MGMNIKSWFYSKISQEAKRYNCFIDVFNRTEDGRIDFSKEYQTVNVEETLGESEKAVHVRLCTGLVDGSYKGWTCWVPKSCIVK